MRNIPVYAASHFIVVEGANVGDELTFTQGLFLDDVYKLNTLARRQQLSMTLNDKGLFIGKNGDVVQPGNSLCLDFCFTLM